MGKELLARKHAAVCPHARCVFPNLLYGEEAAFEASTYLDTRGDKHRTVRGAWQPFFFSGRRGADSHYTVSCCLIFPKPSSGGCNLALCTMLTLWKVRTATSTSSSAL